MDVRMFARITLPLAAVNALTQAARTVMSTIGPVLALQYGFDAGALGMVSAALFASYGLAQLPAGLALDRWGPRRVQAVLCCVAAAGFSAFALADGLAGFVVARLLLGIGISTGLIGMLKGNSEWFPSNEVARATGLGMVVGTLGSFLATVPAQAALPVLGWSGILWCCAGASLAIGLWNLVSVRDQPPACQARTVRTDMLELAMIVRTPSFLRSAPIAALLSALNFTYLGLWAGPWLRDVAHFEAPMRAGMLLLYTLGLLIGGPVTGAAVSAAQRRGWHPMLVPALCTIGLMVVQAALACGPQAPSLVAGLWLVFAIASACGPPAYAAVASQFPASQAGRVSTAINTMTLALVLGLQVTIGQLVQAWPAPSQDQWNARGYTVGFVITLIMQAAALLWAVGKARGGDVGAKSARKR